MDRPGWTTPTISRSLPSNALELALWLEADRMRSLDVSAENLKNQQNVVSEEVRVNVLNQPHAAFEWLDIWQRANTNWNNAHNFYGDLHELEAATLEDVQKFFKTYYAPNNAVLVVVGDTTAADVASSWPKSTSAASRDRNCRRRPTIAEPPRRKKSTPRREDKLARTPALAIAWHLPERMTKDFFALSVLDPLIVGDESATPLSEARSPGSAGHVRSSVRSTSSATTGTSKDRCCSRCAWTT